MSKSGFRAEASSRQPVGGPTNLTGFWQALEATPGLKAVPARWRQQLGPEWDAAWSFFRLSGALATSFPSPDEDSSSEPLKVVCHGPDDFAGVDADGESIRLPKPELMVLEVDREKLNRDIAAALGLDFEGALLDGPSFTYRVGTWRPFAGYSFAAYLTFQLEPDDYHHAMQAIAVRENQPFLLLAPTGRFHLAGCEQIVRERRACFLALADILVLDAAGHWLLTEPGQRAFTAFRRAVAPAETETDAVMVFPTPAGASWAGLRIRFIDGHRVSVKIGEINQTLNYTQMGMADKRSGNPNKQWELLRLFAREHGILAWDSRGAGRDRQKQRDNLVKAMKVFFRIDGDPIRLLPGGKGWQTMFAVKPDA